MLDQAFQALRTYDWGTDLSTLAPIEDALVAAHGNAELSRDLESRLIEAVQGPLSRDARDYVCRKLASVGTAAAVPALAVLLVDPESSHMSRFALERIPAPEAGQSLLNALPAVTGLQKVGVISSLGARRELAAVIPLRQLLGDSDPAVAKAAALSLGTIGTAESAAVLQAMLNSSKGNIPSIIDALLSCAETLLTNNKRADASSIYQKLNHESQSRLVRLAATRGLLACANKRA